MIKITLYLAIGILLGSYISVNIQFLLIIVTILILLLGFSIPLFKRSFSYQILPGLLICFTMLSTGILINALHEEKNFSSHYLNQTESNKDQLIDITFRIHEVLKPSIYYDKYIVDVLTVDQKKTKGKILLNVNRDSLIHILGVDDTYATRVQLSSIKKPLNPYQFDYGRYLNTNYIYRQTFTRSPNLLKASNSSRTIRGRAASFRKIVQDRFKQYNIKGDELAIINALLLGQRQDISRDIYDNYAQAGAIHILAVSGLHVGIILMLLQNLFKPLDRFRSGKQIKIVLIIVILWCFAIIAGLSASVVRAVTMFTIFAIALNLKRPTNVFNTLALSIFILLLIKPNFLFDIGFQLSYLAVLSIVIFEPLIRKLWSPKYALINFFWRIFTVTLSAQIGVLPISLFYFHQFPGLFVLSNLVIIPCLGALLGCGLLIIFLALINLLPVWLASFYTSIIRSMNYFVQWVSDQETFVFQNISFDAIHVLFSYGIIIMVLLLISKKSYKSIVGLIILVICFQVVLIYEHQNKLKNAFIVFHKSRYSILGVKENKHLLVHHNLDTISIDQENLLLNYKVGEDVILSNSNNINDLYIFDNKKMLVIDSLSVYNVRRFKPNFILLRNSPKINLNRVIDSLNPEAIIFDGSNYTSYQNRWILTCESKKIPFHQTSKKGAFIYSY
jgi:competence protein ComEC